MNLEPRTLERIAKEFPPDQQSRVVELLRGYAGKEPERMVWDILHLSKGSMADVRHYLEAARADYRDVLYWAEYYGTDPLMQGRDPKQVAAEIIAKLGNT